jgi:APA family basic amino acid/polyamine antiporter
VTAQLRRQLGLLDATTINLGTIVASGIFLVPASIALALPGTGAILLVWIVGGGVSLLGALCLAELGAAFPQSGGMFVYLREAYGPVWGYLYGWTAGVVINPASIAAIAVAFATYAGVFLPLSSLGIKALAIASIIVLTVLNARGVREGAVTQNLLTIVKVVLLVVLVGGTLVLPGGSFDNLSPWWPSGSVLVGFGTGIVAVLWAFDGWIEVTYVGSEVRNPGWVVPRSIILAVLLATALYLLVTIGFTYVLSPDGTAASSLPASDAAQVTLGAGGAGFVAAAIMISTLGANNGIVFTSARIPFAMARDRLFLPSLGRVHPGYGTPVVALMCQAGVASALALSGTYDQLFTYVVFASWIFYALAAAAVIRMRVKAPELARPYRAWGYPVTPLVFIAFSLYLVVATIAAAPRDALVGIVLIATGVGPYLYWNRKRVTTTAAVTDRERVAPHAQSTERPDSR